MTGDICESCGGSGEVMKLDLNDNSRYSRCFNCAGFGIKREQKEKPATAKFKNDAMAKALKAIEGTFGKRKV